MALLKFITCQIPPLQREPFNIAQRQWSALAAVPGFVAQAGGWNAEDAGEACILGVWRDTAAYGRFMDEIHDQITSGSKQEDCYTSSTVTRLDVLTSIPGRARCPVEAIAVAPLLRVADCRVRPGRIAHFLGAQISIWNPGMLRASGFRGGLFARTRGEERRLFVITGWDNAETHDAYRRDVFPGLQRQAQPDADIEKLTGRRIDMIAAWRVSTALTGATR